MYDLCKYRTKNVYVCYWFVCAIFILLAGLRFYNGADTENYYQIFKDSPLIYKLSASDFYIKSIQPGFVIFVSLCKSIINNFAFQLLCESFILNVVIFTFVKRYSPFPFTTILVYFILNYLEFNMEIMRECLAIACGLMAFIAYDKKKTLLSLFLFMIAWSMHISSLILVLYPLIVKIKYNKHLNRIFFIISVFIPFIYIMIPNVDLYAALLFDQSEEKIAQYSVQNINNDWNVFFYIFQYSKYVIVPYFLIRYLCKHKCIRYIGFIYMYSFLQMLGMISYAFYRFANYMAPFYWICIAIFIGNLLMNNKTFRHIKLFSLVCIVSLLLLFYQKGLLSYETSMDSHIYNRYIPYKTVIFNNRYF